MKKLLSCLLLFIPFWVQAQNMEEQANAIKANPDYLWGEGYGDTEQTADKDAMANLMSKISVQIESDFVIDEREVNTSEGNDAQSTVQNVVRTYSRGTLKNTGSIILSRAPKAVVMRYVKRSELDRMFKDREELIMSYVYSARNNEKRGKLDMALRYYYWASCLLKSMQHPSEVKIESDGMRFPMTMWIPEQMRNIMSDIKPEVTKIEGQDVTLLFKYKDAPVTSLDFHYWDGMEYSNIYSAKDGMMQVEMRPGASTDKIQLQYEYEYKGQMHLEPDLEAVMHIFKKMPYKEASVTVNSGKKSEQKQALAEYQVAIENMSMATHSVQVAQPKDFLKVVNLVVSAIKQKNYEAVKESFTPEGFEMFDRLVHYGNATVMGNHCLNISDKADFQRKVYQRISSTSHVPLPDGKYTMKAYAKMGSTFNELFMYATSGGQTFKTDMTIADGQWHLYTISDVAVTGGMVEVGFYADGPANTWCHIDDVTLVMDTADDDNSETPIAGIPSENIHHTEYFTLSGKRIAAPSQGIFLMRIVKSDGTLVNKKVIQR